MTLRELIDKFSLFLNAQLTEIEGLGSKNILDWPIGYTILVIVLAFISLVFLNVLVERVKGLFWSDLPEDRARFRLVSNIAGVLVLVFVLERGLQTQLAIDRPYSFVVSVLVSVPIVVFLWLLLTAGKKS